MDEIGSVKKSVHIPKISPRSLQNANSAVSSHSDDSSAAQSPSRLFPLKGKSRSPRSASLTLSLKGLLSSSPDSSSHPSLSHHTPSPLSLSSITSTETHSPHDDGVTGEHESGAVGFLKYASPPPSPSPSTHCPRSPISKLTASLTRHSKSHPSAFSLIFSADQQSPTHSPYLTKESENVDRFGFIKMEAKDKAVKESLEMWLVSVMTSDDPQWKVSNLVLKGRFPLLDNLTENMLLFLFSRASLGAFFSSIEGNFLLT